MTLDNENTDFPLLFTFRNFYSCATGKPATIVKMCPFDASSNRRRRTNHVFWVVSSAFTTDWKLTEYVYIEKYMGGPAIYVTTDQARHHVMCTFPFKRTLWLLNFFWFVRYVRNSKGQPLNTFFWNSRFYCVAAKLWRFQEANKSSASIICGPLYLNV
jgi:hypothetical protein